MSQHHTKTTSSTSKLAKCSTGIQGLDEIMDGGFPLRRPTLVCGRAGCGKTLMAIEFLVRGATEYDEPGVFMSFEETAEELTQNVTSFGWDLEALIAEGKFAIDYVYIDPTEIEETGEYDLEGLFIRLGRAIDKIQAKRVALDTLEVLFGGLKNAAIVRAELRRLFRWLKSKGVTAIVTAESGENELTRQGLEEYVSDCVIRLDRRLVEQVATRSLQIVKYRGSKHGTNEYPFLIEDNGMSVVPITSIGLDHQVSSERISSGISRLDTMLGGEGFFRGSSILITGTAGTGKSTIASSFANAVCRRGERCLYFAFEESPNQIIRNMRSINLELESWLENGLLNFQAVRPTLYGLEMHLITMQNLVERFKPSVVIIDPISNINYSSTDLQTKSFLMRTVDFLKTHGITTLFTCLTEGSQPLENSGVGVSSLMDTWLMLRDVETNGERNRLLYIIKSRGMSHSNQVREFCLTSSGIQLVDVYLGQEGVVTGAARFIQEAREKSASLARQHEIEKKQRDIARKRAAMEAQISVLQLEIEAESEEINRLIEEDKIKEEIRLKNKNKIGQIRKADME